MDFEAITTHLFPWTCLGAIITAPSPPGLFVVTMEEVWPRQKRTRPRTIWEMESVRADMLPPLCLPKEGFSLLCKVSLCPILLHAGSIPIRRVGSELEETWSVLICAYPIPPPTVWVMDVFRNLQSLSFVGCCYCCFKTGKQLYINYVEKIFFLTFFPPNNEWEEITQSK